ncbi:MAG: AtpZ/AtpI family protein [Candidatus Sericytochromatia bacterium]|nr:AtpZ/AtpI family protein [Candidatus Sericytochromatia bacterium]
MKHIVTFSGPVIMCLVVGLLLDRKLDTLPWFTLGGVVLGFVSGFVAMLRLLGEPPAGG